MTTESVLPSVFLMPGRDRRLRAGHPWVFSNEVDMTPETRALPPGGIVTLDEYAVHNWRESDAFDDFRKARGLTGIDLHSTPWALSPTAWFRKPA